MATKTKLSSPSKTSQNVSAQRSGHTTKKTAQDGIRKQRKERRTKDNVLSGEIEAILKKGKRAKMPEGITPMLATTVDKAFDNPAWTYEVKWDGYRVLAFINKGTVELISRNNKSFSEKYYPLNALLKELPFNAVLDGEIIVLNENGAAKFNALQNWRSEADGHLVVYFFDILWYNGKDLMHLPLAERQAVLQAVLPPNDDRIRVSQPFTSGGVDFFEAAGKLGLEGIIAKKADSTYTPGNRSKEWLKIKTYRRQEVVIGGYTNNEGSSKQFSSLLLGVFENGEFQYVGKVGTGFSDKLQREMMAQFKPLIVKKCPFSFVPDVNKPSRFRPNPPKAIATWLKPELVCEVSYAEVTDDGVFRHPSFEGMRSDKAAKSVMLETQQHTADIVAAEKENKKGRKLIHAPKDDARHTLLNPTEETQVKIVAGHELKFTNLSKIYWPDDGITKRDMLNYYYQVAEYIVPYIKDRPQSLNRFPNGIKAGSFYQKDVKGKAPSWVKTFPYTTSEGEDKEFLVGDDEASLMWMASLGCIEMNPWFSRVDAPDNPDYCVIDLDPDKNTFEQVITAALETKKVLDSLKVTCYPKTSGSTGMHIYIPLGAKYTYEQSQLFGRIVATLVHQRIPKFTSIERQIKNRKGKMYVDFLQNRPGATLACPYSLRPKPGATVSMALHWDEVKPGLTMRHFTIHNSIQRLRKEGDLFKDVLGKGIDLMKVLAEAQEAL